MNRPLMALSGLIVAGGVAGGALLITSSGGEEEAVQQAATASVGVEASADETPLSKVGPTPTLPVLTPGAGVTLYRWAKVTVLIPDGMGIIAGPDVAGATEGRPLDFTILRGDPEGSRVLSEVVVDAETGAIVEDRVIDRHRPEFDLVLATLKVGPFDTGAAPWPYKGEPAADLVRENQGGISWIRPPAASGLYVGGGLRDPGGVFITLQNERSIAFVGADPLNGEFSRDMSHVLAEDLDVFQRWLATVKQCGTEIEC